MEFPHRRYLHRQPGPADWRRAEGCQDDGVRLTDQSRQSRLELPQARQGEGTVGDDADLQEVYDTERHLLYVACTRARDYLLVTSVEPASEFVDDMQESFNDPFEST